MVAVAGVAAGVVVSLAAVVGLRSPVHQLPAVVVVHRSPAVAVGHPSLAVGVHPSLAAGVVHRSLAAGVRHLAVVHLLLAVAVDFVGHPVASLVPVSDSDHWDLVGMGSYYCLGLD